MRIAIVLENMGGELDRILHTISDEEDYVGIRAALESDLGIWSVSVGDTIKIEEAT